MRRLRAGGSTSVVQDVVSFYKKHCVCLFLRSCHLASGEAVWCRFVQKGTVCLISLNLNTELQPGEAPELFS
jgi:hypothetical protein